MTKDDCGEDMRLAPITPLFLVAMALAGCADGKPSISTPDGLTPASALPALELAWGLTGCRFGVALIDVPAADVQPFVPEGFRILSVAEVGVEPNAPMDVPNPRGDGNFGIELFQCDEGVGLDGTVVPAIVYGSFFTAVEPPMELRRDVDFHFVKWDTLVPDEPRRELLQSYGMPVRNGTASVTQRLGQGSVSSYAGTLTFEGGESYTFQGASALPQAGVTFVEYMVTPGGLAAWSTTVEFLVGGVGPQTVTVPAGSFAAEVLGSGTFRGAGFAGIANFAGGLIQVPAQP